MMLQKSSVAKGVRAQRASRASSVVVRASSRPLWAPNVVAPSYLDGTLPGDYGQYARGLDNGIKLLL